MAAMGMLARQRMGATGRAPKSTNQKAHLGQEMGFVGTQVPGALSS